ncbi:MAG TPA: arsenate reductase ArsC [Acidobacteriota bacterium]|nr:arsenate reductase ArsC [Acidobacteriota bacterium]
MKTRILVLCTGNSARSQIAEGFFREKAGKTILVESAGTKPKNIHPLAVAVMKESGIDISRQRSKDVASFAGEKFDHVITVCDNAKENCPVFPGAKTTHWSIPDPITLEDFRKVRDELEGKITALIALLELDSPSR